MSQVGTVYATKRRRRNGKSNKPAPVDTSNSKSNPSKRHRLRLNAELDTLASLLPYEQSILSKLDRLSILRLAVAYLRTKTYFQGTLPATDNSNDEVDGPNYRRDGMLAYDSSLNGDSFMQALNGFLLILDCEGEVFFSTYNIENYLGFHQSDIIHQSVYELVHSEDREELQRQFLWNGCLPVDKAGLSKKEVLAAHNKHLLERSFTVRFRCLLDNTSGFLRLDIRGRIKALKGHSRTADGAAVKCDEPTMALFALCTPFGPPSLLEMPHKEMIFKTKHSLDLTLINIDQRGKTVLGYDDEIINKSGYALVHHDDMSYVSSAHQELLKTGASGLIAYRLQTKKLNYQWLQTSSRLVYKNSKPDFIISTHRPLLEEEGEDLLVKRTMDFKVSYLDPGLSSQYLYDGEVNSMLVGGVNGGDCGGASGGAGSTRPGRRQKSQLRDFLSTSRSKRKMSASAVVDPYSSQSEESAAIAAAAAAAAAYGQYTAAVGYGGSVATAPYPTDPAAAYPGAAHGQLQSFQNLYPAIESHRLLPAPAVDTSFYYRQLGGYYPSSAVAAEYAHHHQQQQQQHVHFQQQLSGGGYTTLSDVARIAGYEQSSASHMARAAESSGYLTRSPYYDAYSTTTNGCATVLGSGLADHPPPPSQSVVDSAGAAITVADGYHGGEVMGATTGTRHSQQHSPAECGGMTTPASPVVDKQDVNSTNPYSSRSDGAECGSDGASDKGCASAASMRQTVLMWGGSGSLGAPPNLTTQQQTSVCSPSPGDSTRPVSVTSTSSPSSSASVAQYSVLSNAGPGHYLPLSPPPHDVQQQQTHAALSALEPLKAVTAVGASSEVCRWVPRLAAAPPVAVTDADTAGPEGTMYTELSHVDNVWAPYTAVYHAGQPTEVYPAACAKNGSICCPSLR